MQDYLSNELVEHLKNSVYLLMFAFLFLLAELIFYTLVWHSGLLIAYI